MKTITPLSYVNQAMSDLEGYFIEKIKDGKIAKIDINNKSRYIIFLSVGNPNIRARVLKVVTNDFSKGVSQLRQKAIQLVQKVNIDPRWIKMDVVNKIETLSLEELELKISKTRKNYFRSGIAFDADFHLAFLEQEIHGNAMIKNKKDEPLQLDEMNINQYLKRNFKNRSVFTKKRYYHQPVYTFNTMSVFKELENPQLLELYNGELTNGIRKIKHMKEETKELIKGATYFLVNQVQESGQFHYGYFAAFGKRIGTYNILRHSSSLYSMLEGYEVLKDEQIIHAVEKGMDYLIREAIVYQEHHAEKIAYVVDYANHQEIKLGSNATAILAMTKYMEVTNSHKYLDIAQALARGILKMKTPSGGFIHVLSYPTFEIKDIHRIIYYEGEAILSLLRLYKVDKNDLWLNEVKHTFDYFIAHDYWKHHDHWLSYATNELILYAPEDQYFIFGLKNCDGRLSFIYHRETTYPTFLELTMAAYKMIDQIKKRNRKYLLKHVDETFLEKTIDKRAEYQRVGFFYPELAMYTKNPSLIVGTFFIRHHSFRVRIDDVEHYLSGYCQYLHYRIPKMRNPLSADSLNYS
ncbi:hypothetical protein MUB24_19865 [Lederbergia sp. NSJ-179]|uniref:hypothetical protein n=1 Tax=Lederbergia sp. NSJ-179 TaxID=2931402 RepID=UPI001FD26F3B|nr:hypothetical protein [Lederbergia sp. NSJ-179]MCJ7843092.1 hypothetical protein [Lederbergia sp. NSJ-179]